MHRFFITGVVQGVGFRPFVHNACRRRGLKGFVQNIGDGVVVEVDDADAFQEILKNLPPLARIDAMTVEESSGEYEDFRIIESEGEGHSEVPPDLFTCDACLKDLEDDDNRRKGYFFITCTDCGPRFSIVTGSPYDRPKTTMDAFAMCERCRREYTDSSDRRYHAETIACHDCGPKLSLLDGGDVLAADASEAIARAAELLQDGEVIAIKGVGGFHMCCKLEASAIGELRRLNGRPDKPFAVMCKDIGAARRLAPLNGQAEEVLTSPARPVVIVDASDAFTEVSELRSYGLMLPYTALHFLLFEHFDGPLVMTSANKSDEPISTEATGQLTRYVLTHDRVIENPVDDSVIKMIDDVPLLVRRSRGFVPASLPLASSSTKSVLALGAEMNASFCLHKDGRAVLSPYLGTVSNPSAMERYRLMLEKFLSFTHFTPDVVIADLHPSYATTLLAERISAERGIPLIRVQHHRAHAFSVAAEHGLTECAAIVCDGLGYGEDDTVWGGEVFAGSERIGHLELHPQIGGDSAAHHPARMLYAILSECSDSSHKQCVLTERFSSEEISVFEKQMNEQFNAPLTSSCGRVFDAAAALLGLCDERTYEGRPAMLLDAHSTEPLALEPVMEDGVLLTVPLFEFLLEHLQDDRGRLAATVQHYIASGLHQIAHAAGLPVVASGGCMYSSVMARFMRSRGVHLHRSVPSGDGGIAFGQAAYFSANAGHDVA